MAGRDFLWNCVLRFFGSELAAMEHWTSLRNIFLCLFRGKLEIEDLYLKNQNSLIQTTAPPPPKKKTVKNIFCNLTFENAKIHDYHVPEQWEFKIRLLTDRKLLIFLNHNFLTTMIL